MGKNSERNRKIVEFVKSYYWSFQLVADHFGVTRNVVAGVMFRHHHPVSERVMSPNKRSANKIGTGYRKSDYKPSITARNSVVERAA